jgi:hypothetical protein
MDKLGRATRVNPSEWNFLMERYLAGDQDLSVGYLVSLMREHIRTLDKRIKILERKMK